MIAHGIFPGLDVWAALPVVAVGLVVGLTVLGGLLALAGVRIMRRAVQA